MFNQYDERYWRNLDQDKRRDILEQIGTHRAEQLCREPDLESTIDALSHREEHYLLDEIKRNR